MSVDAVIFDLGNVLIEWQPERYFDRVIGVRRRRALFETVDLHTMNHRIDLGAPFRETVYATAEASPPWRNDIRRWHDDWIEIAHPVIPRSVELLRVLRAKGVPVFALSNFGRETFAYAKTQYPFLEEFDRRYISGHMGIVKPAEEIYRVVEEDCGLVPERLLFTDDRAENLATAAARGWRVHLFEGPEGLADRLVAEGLLSVAEAA